MRKGVTLIELLIVMIIVAILSIVIFVSMSGNVDQAQDAAFQDFLNNARVAVQSYNAKCMQINPTGDAIRRGAANAETLTWTEFLTGTGLTAKKIDDSDETPVPAGNKWLSGLTSEADLKAKFGGRFHSDSTFVKRTGKEWRLHHKRNDL